MSDTTFDQADERVGVVPFAAREQGTGRERTGDDGEHPEKRVGDFAESMPNCMSMKRRARTASETAVRPAATARRRR